MALRIAYMSDVHNEFERGRGPTHPSAEWLALEKMRKGIQGHPANGPILDDLRGENVHLMVLAGDIDFAPHAIDYADQVSLFLNVPVVSVLGNHEGYDGRDLEADIRRMRSEARLADGQVSFLENEIKVFNFPQGRLHVLGCTLWTDYELLGTPEVSMREAAAGLNDHRLMRLHGKHFAPEDALNFHLVSRLWLAAEVSRIRSDEGLDAKILIVTHHAPHGEGGAPNYRGGALSPAFASDLTAEIMAWRPTAWIFGHTHYSCRIDVDGIPVVAAQRGYVCSEPGAETFRPAVIEI